MSQVQTIRTSGRQTTLTLLFDLDDSLQVLTFGRVLSLVGSVMTGDSPTASVPRPTVAREEAVVGVPANFVRAVSQKLGLTKLPTDVNRAFQTLCLAFYRDPTLTKPVTPGGKPGQKSERTAQAIIEMATTSESLVDLSEQMRRYIEEQLAVEEMEVSSEAFDGLAEILFQKFRPEDTFRIEEEKVDGQIEPAGELVLEVARRLNLNGQLGNPALTQFCQAMLQQGKSNAAQVRHHWDEMLKGADTGLDGVVALLVEKLGLSDDENTLLLAEALQHRRKFFKLNREVANRLDRELSDGGIPTEEARFRGESAFSALIGRLLGEEIENAEEILAMIGQLLEEATSEYNLDDILADRYHLSREGEYGVSLRKFAHALWTLRTVRRISSNGAKVVSE